MWKATALINGCSVEVIGSDRLELYTRVLCVSLAARVAQHLPSFRLQIARLVLQISCVKLSRSKMYLLNVKCTD